MYVYHHIHSAVALHCNANELCYSKALHKSMMMMIMMMIITQTARAHHVDSSIRTVIIIIIIIIVGVRKSTHQHKYTTYYVHTTSVNTINTAHLPNPKLLSTSKEHPTNDLLATSYPTQSHKHFVHHERRARCYSLVVLESKTFIK